MAEWDSTLPTFFVIGAPKCGTTSLHSYLDRHPAVSMSSVKEPWVFAREDYRERLAEYPAMFKATASARGESSAVYALYPHFPDVPERIVQVLPDARFVYVVGDPIRRAVSHHAQRVTDGTESRALEEAMADLESTANVYVAGSRYATQLQRYLENFPAERVLVIDQDALRAETAAAISEIFGFLDVDPSVQISGTFERLNVREDHRVATALGVRFRGNRVYEGLRSLPLPRSVRDRLREATSRHLGRPELEPDTRQRLAKALKDEIGWVREFTGKDFPGWSL